MSVKELQNRNVDPALRAVIADSIREILDDPDFGLELTAATKKRLQSAKNKKQNWTSLDEIRAKYC